MKKWNIELNHSGPYGIIRTTFEARTVEEAFSRSQKILSTLKTDWYLYKIEEMKDGGERKL